MTNSASPKPTSSTEGSSSPMETSPTKTDWIQRLKQLPTTEVAEVLEFLLSSKKESKEGKAKKSSGTGTRRASVNTDKKLKGKQMDSPRNEGMQKDHDDVEASKAAGPSMTKQVSTPPSLRSAKRKAEGLSESTKRQGRREELGKEPSTDEVLKTAELPKKRRIKMKARKHIQICTPPSDDEMEGEEKNAEGVRVEGPSKAKGGAAGEKKVDEKEKKSRQGTVEVRRSSRLGLHSFSKKKQDNTPLIISESEEEKTEEEEQQNARMRSNKIREKEEVLRNLEIRVERRFSTKMDELPEFISRVISFQGWEKLCSMPAIAHEGTVIKFYARLALTDGFMVDMDGKQLCCDATNINAIYGISNGSKAEGNKIIWNPTETQEQEALQLLSRGKTKWTYSTRGVKSILAAELKSEPAVWLNFLRNRICPTTHYTTVSLEKVMVLYCLFKDIKIDVGSIISNELREISKKTVGSLFFPALITDLCKKGGVRLEGKVLESKPIDLHNIAILQRLSEKKAMKMEAAAPAEEKVDGQSEDNQQAVDNARWKKLTRKLQLYFHYCKERDAAIHSGFYEIIGCPLQKFPEFPATLLRDDSSDDDQG